jgi:hypothetical protein
MKYTITLLTFTAAALAASIGDKGDSKGTLCLSKQTVVCEGNGDGKLISLGNIASGALGDSCSGGDVYCCSEEDVNEV